MEVEDRDRDGAQQDQHGDRAEHDAQQARRDGGGEAMVGGGLGRHADDFTTRAGAAPSSGPGGGRAWVESRGVRRSGAAQEGCRSGRSEPP